MGYRRYGAHGQLGTWTIGTPGVCGTGGMGHMANRAWAMGHRGQWGTGGIGHMGNGAHGQCGTGGMGYRGMGHMGSWSYGQWGTYSLLPGSIACGPYPCTLLCHLAYCPCGSYPLYPLPIFLVPHCPCDPLPIWPIPPVCYCPMCPIAHVLHHPCPPLGNGTHG